MHFHRCGFAGITDPTPENPRDAVQFKWGAAPMTRYFVSPTKSTLARQNPL
jgi:hypothetical protein